MMKRWMPVLCIAFAATSFLGASAWEGSAMMSAFGEFPESGFYAACNSFPRNTAVEVVNLENGKTVTVIVTKGLENPGIFLLLSPEAAKALSLEPGALSRVRVSAPRNIAQTVPAGPGAAGDPDFNPSLLAARSGVSTTTAEPAAEPPVEPQAAASAPAAESAPETPIQASEAPASVPSAVAQGTGSQEGPSPEPGAGTAPSGSNSPDGALEQPDEPPQGPAVVVETPKTPILEVPVVQPELLSRPVLEAIEPAPVAVFLPTPWRETAMIAAAGVSVWLTPAGVREENEFTYHPIEEVAILFAGIFATMLPAMLILKARGGELGVTDPAHFFWAAGTLSSFLD
ncbi:MAG: hypothetical protein GX430_09220, partial [Treponema sp.]|nr:hypothetical protein [Treponema sp.]